MQSHTFQHVESFWKHTCRFVLYISVNATYVVQRHFRIMKIRYKLLPLFCAVVGFIFLELSKRVEVGEVVKFDFSCNRIHIHTIQKAHLCTHTCYQVFICRTSFDVQKTSLLCFSPYFAITILLTSLNMTPSNSIVRYRFYKMYACSRQF